MLPPDRLEALVGIVDLPDGTDAFIRDLRGPDPDAAPE
jgi:hypothetical protein